MVEWSFVSSFDNPYERLLSIKEVYVSLYILHETFYLSYYKYDRCSELRLGLAAVDTLWR
jgi:hypothetical protein